MHNKFGDIMSIFERSKIVFMGGSLIKHGGQNPLEPISRGCFVLSGDFNKNFEEITSTIDLADTFYKNSFYSIKDIPISFRFSILVARRIYRKIGYNILNKKTFENYKNSGKIYVSNIEKSIETIFAIFDLIRLSLTNIKEDQIQHDHFLINEEINLDERI